MKTNLNKYTLSTMILCCASIFSINGSAQTAPQDPRYVALAPWAAKGEVVFVDVPAASNALSNMLLVASIKSGSGSQSVERIVALLRHGSNAMVAVMGQKQSVTDATVIAALKELAKLAEKSGGEMTSTASPATLILVGNPEDEKALQDAATAAAIHLEIARVP